MSEQRETDCPTCGEPMPAGAPEGLCPRCLLGRADPDSGPKPPAPEIDELNRTFPAYEVQELIGHGGMGAVYKARHKKLDRPVALKVLPKHLSEDATFAERFLREARAMARLDHPFVVTIHDFGEIDGTYYLAMEFVEGSNLRQLMAEKLTPKQALAIVPQVCEALAYAHENGIVHRDIKPENILVDAQGRVRIADFGLAKLVQPGRDQQSLTGTYQVMGTLHYMAPEQFETPTEVDHRADIFSLGVVFYEMLTGELPLGRFDAPSQAKKGVDARLDKVVMKSLERKRENRYQEVSEVKTDVERIGGGPKPGRPPRVEPEPVTESVKARAALLRIAWAGGLTLLFSFFPWVAFYREMPVSNTVATENLNVWAPVYLTLLGAKFPCWVFSLAGFGLGILAVLQLTVRTEFSWKAYTIGAGVSALFVLGLCVFAAAEDYADPILGAICTLGSLTVIAVSGLALKPAPAGGRRRKPVRRSTSRRSGRRAPRSKSPPRQ